MSDCTKPNFPVESLHEFLKCWANVLPFALTLPFALAIVIGCERGAGSAGKDEKADSNYVTVDMAVHFGESAESKSFEVVIDKQSPTVLDAMECAEEAGKLVFAHRGNGEFAFLEAIDMTINQGSDGDNWVFSVNGALGNESFGTYPIEAGDRIEWRFGAYDPDK